MKPCLKCDYDLTGLPDEHACPECGLAYDPHNVRIRLASTFGPAGTAAILVMALWILVAPSCVGRTRGAFESWAFTILAVYGFVVVLRSAHRRATRRRIIFNREGLHVFRRDALHVAVPWEQIVSANVSGVTRALKLLDPRGGLVLKVSAHELGRARYSRQFADEIMRLKELYAADEDGASPSGN